MYVINWFNDDMNFCFYSGLVRNKVIVYSVKGYYCNYVCFDF